MSVSRVLSLLLAGTYLVGGFRIEGAAGSARVAAYLILPLACIWFPEDTGRFASVVRITRTTPGPIVAIGGWLLLLLPLVIAGVTTPW